MTPSRDITLDSQQPDLGIDISKFIGATSMSFVVADPSKPDTPIVYVNRAFELTTGYSHRFVVGRNCRFLQGPDTDPDAVRNIAIALSRGEGVRQTLLNYRADGTPFINDLVITPINNAKGEVAYFVGVQRELSSSAGDGEERVKRKTVDIIRQQVQLHLSVVMSMGRLHHTPDAGEDFGNLMRRLEVLDLLYENITDSAMEDELLDIGAYVSQIAAKLAARTPRPGVRINISTEAVVASLDIAVRLGIALAELVDRALNTSLQGVDSGQLEVSLARGEGDVVLSVFDDGLHGPDAREWLSGNDITLNLVRGVIGDIGGTLHTEAAQGEREFVVRVPVAGGDAG